MDEKWQKSFPVSWDQFHRDARALAWRLSGAGPFQSIVAVTRGGLVPAAVVARELGIRVPEDLSVVGVDDHELAAMFDLTTVRQDPRRQGADAVAVLLGDIGAGEEAPTTDVRAQLKLVVRGSAAPPSA